MLFHCLAGGKHLSDETVAWAKSQNFRVLSPSRAGFSRSESSQRNGASLLQTHVQDTAELVQAVGAAGPVTAVCFGTGFSVALSYAIAHPQRCRDLVAINPIPPMSAIGKASNLKGSFKVGFMAAKYAPVSFKALPYFHARMHRATRETRTSPTVLPGYDLKALETVSGYAAFKQNADDALSNGPDTIWSEASLSLSDWLPSQVRQNSLPRIIWVETADSPFTQNGAFEDFRKSIGADLIKVDRTFPLYASQLPTAFASLRQAV
ncbi:alpha/beta hydrolase [Yoonia sp. GPGPB17]|uniref:alpha/beta fold hydrolase n=1 Tax=Yoonia sp. GPGPB17 TaxID=3026147 RepID=UPI0030BADE43